MNSRTTYVGESMHKSMKFGYGGIRASMSIDVSANKMMDKSQRKGKDLNNFNATQVSRHIVHGDHVKYLTDWSHDKALKESELSKNCHGMKMKLNEYWVYTPYVNTVVCASTVHPKFYRFRVIKVLKDKFMSCLCGLPARMKYPCRHILYFIGGFYQQIFAVRCDMFYQHTFERKGYEDVTAIYRELEDKQFSRDWKNGEHILVADCGNFKTLNEIIVSDKPALLEGTLAIHKDTMMYIDRVMTSGQPVIR